MVGPLQFYNADFSIIASLFLSGCILQAAMMRFESSANLQLIAHRLIPGGCHAYAKSDREYPDLSPGFIARGLGCHVWDVDGNEFIEYAPGNRSVSLGHAFPDVIQAVADELTRGVNFSRPAEIEVRAAKRLLDFVPHSEMVKFCKNGSDATSAAVRLARAATGRNIIACCAEHPFFAFNDWFIGTTPNSAGVPHCTQSLTLLFHYNNIDSVSQLFNEHPGQIAGLILEPAKYEEPQNDFLANVRQLCLDHDALLILDEMITGFRWDLGGGQAVYDVDPDLSCWGKSMANGFSVSALSGKRKYMELGSLASDNENVFLLSTTHGGETHALAAALATMDVYANSPVISTFYERGTKLAAGCDHLIKSHHLQPYFEVIGRPCCLNYVAKDAAHKPSSLMRALFLQETIRRGVLMSSMVVTYSHSDQDVDQTLAAIDDALGVYAKAITGDATHFLVGPPPRPVYRRISG